MGKKDNYLSIAIGIVKEYYEHKYSIDSLKIEFDDVKEKLSKIMNMCFDDISDDGKHIFIESEGIDDDKFVVTRIISSKVTWDINKLKKVIPKKYRKSIIKKKYQVTDWQGMFQYLKDIGVDFDEFKKYLDCEEYVLESSIDKLIDLGYVDSDSIKECSIVETKEPQYRVSKKK